MSINRRFLDQLPFTLPILGRDVRIGKTPENKITIELADCDDCSKMDAVYSDWQMRKWIIVKSPDEHANYSRMRERLLVSDAMKDFVKFLITQPIGPRIFLLNSQLSLSEHDARIQAIDEAALTWDAVTNWDRKKNGKLAFPIPCGAYRSKLEYAVKEDELASAHDVKFFLCTANVIDASGFCGPHKKPGAKTLFNHYPFFVNDGLPELVPQSPTL